MPNKDSKAKFCGNCDSHNAYDYPEKVFCSTRYAQNKDPIVRVLWFCDEWNRISQECYCVREALHKSHGNSKQR